MNKEKMWYKQQKLLGNLMKQYRLNANLMDVKTVSEELGISRVTLWREERGEHLPRKITLKQLSKLYGLSNETTQELLDLRDYVISLRNEDK